MLTHNTPLASLAMLVTREQRLHQMQLLDSKSGKFGNIDKKNQGKIINSEKISQLGITWKYAIKLGSAAGKKFF